MKMILKIVAKDLSGLQKALKALSQEKYLDSNCYMQIDDTEIDYDIIDSDDVYGDDSQCKVISDPLML